MIETGKRQDGHLAKAIGALGARGLGPVAGVMLGSVSHAVVRDAPCSVLVCRSGARPVRTVTLGVDYDVECVNGRGRYTDRRRDECPGLRVGSEGGPTGQPRLSAAGISRHDAHVSLGVPAEPGGKFCTGRRSSGHFVLHSAVLRFAVRRVEVSLLLTTRRVLLRARVVLDVVLVFLDLVHRGAIRARLARTGEYSR